MGIMSKRNASRAKLTLCLIAVAITVGRWTGCASQVTSHVQLKLGAMYATGNGVPQNDQEAAKWYRKAAEQGHAGAQFLLGTMYVTGKGVPQDYREAAKWTRKAAEQGLAEAQYGLGYMYVKGEGVPQDFLQAHAWMNLAAGQGYKRAAEHRDRVATRMTPAQVFEAQQLAAELRDRIEADINGRGRELTGTMPQPRHAAEPQAQSTNRISEYGVVTDPREARDTEPGEWDGAYRVGSGVTPPTVLSRIEPVYSEAARKAKLQGKVVLSAIVRKDGSLEVLSVVRGLGLGLDENAIKALKKWRFRPGKRSGKPVDVALNIEVDFSLRSRF